MATPAFTVIAGLVLAVLLPSSKSVAVRVVLPMVLRVTLKVLVPDTSPALAGRLALLSVAVMPTL